MQRASNGTCSAIIVQALLHSLSIVIHAAYNTLQDKESAQTSLRMTESRLVNFLMQRGGIEIIQVSNNEGASMSAPAWKKAKGPRGQVIVLTCDQGVYARSSNWLHT